MLTDPVHLIKKEFQYLCNYMCFEGRALKGPTEGPEGPQGRALRGPRGRPCEAPARPGSDREALQPARVLRGWEGRERSAGTETGGERDKRERGRRGGPQGAEMASSQSRELLGV